MPNQESVHALVGAYATDALEDDEREAFEWHFARCAECRDEVASLREAAVLMSVETEVVPPPGLRDRLLGEVARVRPLPPTTRPTTDQPTEGARVLPFRRRVTRAVGHGMSTHVRAVVAAAVVAVLAVVGIGVAQPWTDDAPPSSDLVAQRVLGAPDATSVTQRFPDGSSATVTRSVDEGLAVLQTTDMPDPPSRRVFELWLLDATGTPVPAGTMSAAGDSTVVLTGDASDAESVAITVEPEGGSEQPTTDPIASFDLEDA